MISIKSRSCLGRGRQEEEGGGEEEEGAEWGGEERRHDVAALPEVFRSRNKGT